MNRVKITQQRQEQLPQIGRRHRAGPSYVPAQRLAVDVFHHDIAGIIFLKAVMHSDDVGKVQLCQQLRLLLEAMLPVLEGLRVLNAAHLPALPGVPVRKAVREKLLDRDEPLQPVVPCLIGNSKAAVPKRRADFVPPVFQRRTVRQSRPVADRLGFAFYYLCYAFYYPCFHILLPSVLRSLFLPW